MILSQEQRILISGFSLHESKHDRFGEKYNAFNYGIGYEYNFFENYNEPYFGMNMLLLNDSFENPQLSIGFGHNYRFDMDYADISVGIAGFVGYKKIYSDDDISRDGGQYKIMGGVGPSFAVYKGNFSIDFIYIPSIKYNSLDITGFLFTYFSYKF